MNTDARPYSDTMRAQIEEALRSEIGAHWHPWMRAVLDELDAERHELETITIPIGSMELDPRAPCHTDHIWTFCENASRIMRLRYLVASLDVARAFEIQRLAMFGADLLDRVPPGAWPDARIYDDAAPALTVCLPLPRRVVQPGVQLALSVVNRSPDPMRFRATLVCDARPFSVTR